MKHQIYCYNHQDFGDMIFGLSAIFVIEKNKWKWLLKWTPLWYLAFCQTLTSQGKAFNFKLTNTPFSFTSDTKGINVKSTVDKKRISPSTQRRNARRREEFLKRSSTLSHLHHLNLKDNFSSDIANSFFMDVLSPFWRGRWLPPTQYLYYVKIGAKDSGQRLFRGGGGSLRRGRKRVAPPQSDGKNRFLLTRLVFCQIIHLFEWNISHFPPPLTQNELNKSSLTLARFCHLIQWFFRIVTRFCNLFFG